MCDELDEKRPAVILLKDLHLKSHELDRAIVTLATYLKDHPEEALRLELLALYVEAERTPAAVEGLLAFLPRVSKEFLPQPIALAQSVLAKDPMQHDLARALAHAQRRNGDYAGAARSLESYLRGEDAAREARVELAQNLEDAGNVEAASEALRPLLEGGEPTADELSYAAALLARLERHEAALPLLKKAFEKRPDDRSLKERHERAESALRDKEAARLMEEARAGRASEDDKRKLAGLLAEAGKKEETLQILRTIPGIPPGDPESVFYRFAAEQFSRRGRIDKAEAALRQLCSILAYPAGSEQEKAMLYRIGALYERAGDRRSARRAYLELVARDPRYRDAYAKLESQADATVLDGADVSDERSLAQFVETEVPREVKSIFDSLQTLDLALDQALLADERAATAAAKVKKGGSGEDFTVDDV